MGLGLMLFLPMVVLMGISIAQEDDEEDTPAENPDVRDDPPEEEEVGRTGLFVSEDMFGTNAPYTVATDHGAPTPTFESAVDAFGLEEFRFPSGRAEDSGVEGEDWLDVTALTEDGALRPELTDFLEGVEGEVTLVISTTNAALEDYGEGLSQWAERVLNEYGAKIAAFEVGNEYWARMGETEYGQRANIAVEELAEGIAAAQAGSPEILVQMGSVYGESEFGSDVDARGFVDRVNAANHTIIDQLSPEAMAHIDGVVEHYYWVRGATSFDDTSREYRYINIDLAVWEDRFDHDLSFHVTEWNLRASNTACNGLMGMSVLVEMVENMVELGVDAAHVWPIVHNTTNDLGGPADDGHVDRDAQGRVTETLRGAVFDLMSDVLPGMELIEVDIPGAPDGFQVAAFERNGEFVFFLTNASLEQVDLDLDLSAIIPEIEVATGVQIGMDARSSDGTHWTPRHGRIEADYVEINGARHHYNEHDVQALYTDHVFAEGRAQASLLPFELLMIQATAA